MILEKVITPGIAHYSYFIGSGDEAAVIDPRRDFDTYLELAAQHRQRIAHIFETHRNEDYVIGSIELAEKTGAAIHHGSALQFGYGKGVREGERFRLGALDLKIIETPGHTEESISIAVEERSTGKVLLVFTGDALFAGDTGRTDFFPGREEEMAGKLHTSLKKIFMCGDHAVICPAHGAGSICAGSIADRPVTTIGYERMANPLLSLGREEFVREKLREQHYFPPYFRRMEEYNLNGSPRIGYLPALIPLSPREVETLMAKKAQIVDIRSPTSFAGGHIPGSLNIWRDGIAQFSGWVLNYSDPIVLVDDFNLGLEDVRRQLLRIGYDNLAGYLSGGFGFWIRQAKPSEVLPQYSPEELHRLLDRELYILDLRTIGNRKHAGHIEGSHHRWVGELPSSLQEIPGDREVVTYCDAGYKGSLGASILLRSGYRRVRNLAGGTSAWVNAGYPLVKQGRAGQ